MQIFNSQIIEGIWGNPIDRKGRSAKVENITITSSDETLLAVVTPNPATPDNPLSFTATPSDDGVGTATVTITADADLDPTVTTNITDFFSVDVKPEQAVGFAPPTTNVVDKP